MYSLSDRDIERLRRMLHDFEARQGQPSSRQLPNWQHVRVTGVANVGGSGLRVGADGSGSGDDEIYYPGVVVKWDASRREMVDLGVCWVRDWNQLDLAVDGVYAAQQTGSLELDIDGIGSGTAQERRPLFVTGGSAGAGEILTFITCIKPVYVP